MVQKVDIRLADGNGVPGEEISRDWYIFWYFCSQNSADKDLKEM